MARSETGHNALEACAAVSERAAEMLRWDHDNQAWPLNSALSHLTLGRAALHGALLHVGESLRGSQPVSERPDYVTARRHMTAAVDGLRQAGEVESVARGLLTRAWLRFLLGDGAGCGADSGEVQEIAERGPMPLHLADLYLTRARLLRDPAALATARDLIASHGYHRRDEELADAEAML